MAGTSVWFGDLAALTVAFVVSVVATPIVRSYAIRWKLGDKPNGRAIHTRLIPHLGGVALFLGVTAGMAVAIGGGSVGGEWSRLLLGALPPVGLILALGLIDDTRNLRAKQKLAVQFVAAILLVAVGFRLYPGASVASAALPAMVTLFFLVGMLSSINLVDGHDGLAAGVTLIAAAAFGTIAHMTGAGEIVAVSLALCGACLGFLVFNFPPGRIYMGDTGSMLLGLLLGLAACLISMRTPTGNTFAAVCLVLGVPLLDTVLAITRRLVLRSPLLAADHLHMHHLLRNSGLSARATLSALCGIQLLLALLGVAAAAGWVLPMVLGFVVVTAVFASFLRVMITERPVPEKISPSIPSSTIPFQRNFSTDIPERRTSFRP